MSLAEYAAQAGRYARSWLATVDRVAGYGVIGLVYLYRWTLGWLLGGRCRFVPSCSQYCIEAVQRYGAARGVWKTIGRLLRCHPFHPGGYDPP